MYRHKYHILPPEGWLNDPNGSCYFNGKYHVFFQYSPGQPEGGDKYWGHYESPDMVNWKYVGIAISPDMEYDCDGAYSGCAYVDDGTMEIFYTGNVKHPGNYDYINEGRGHNVLALKSVDGTNMSDKEVILVNADYPSDMSCHVRDPKVWREDDDYFMLLGARTRDSKPALLLYKSNDKKNWKLDQTVYADEKLGFMLECPDFFLLNDNIVVAACPQGMEHEEMQFQNIYESGYFTMKESQLADYFGDNNSDKTEANDRENLLDELLQVKYFTEWDMGFDFYAPQSFQAADGRRILIGWAGVPDAPYNNDASVEEGWQHSMTVPGVLTMKQGHIYRYPIRELASLHINERRCEIESDRVIHTTSESWDLLVTEIGASESVSITINSDVSLTYDRNTKVCMLTFHNNTGSGRGVRKADMSELPSGGALENIRILFDKSLLEIYINDGETVFTSRYYPKKHDDMTIRFEGMAAEATYCDMKEAIS